MSKFDNRSFSENDHESEIYLVAKELESIQKEKSKLLKRIDESTSDFFEARDALIEKYSKEKNKLDDNQYKIMMFFVLFRESFQKQNKEMKELINGIRKREQEKRITMQTWQNDLRQLKRKLINSIMSKDPYSYQPQGLLKENMENIPSLNNTNRSNKMNIDESTLRKEDNFLQPPYKGQGQEEELETPYYNEEEGSERDDYD